MKNDPRQLLKQLETSARKRFGQHFLTNDDVVARIIRGARVKPGDKVVEIGPGLGVLTRALLDVGAQVTAVELDRDLAGFIRETLPMVNLIEGDAARIDWSTVVEPGATVVANLPYNVGTKVVMQLLRTGLFTRITVMLQREVVDRIMAPHGNKKYGALTVEAGVRAAPVFVCSVEPKSFHPPPKVQSAVLRFDVFEDGPHTGGISGPDFDRVVRAAFAQRRKTLPNSMGSLFEKPKVVSVLEEMGINPQIRAEALSIAQFREFANKVMKRSKYEVRSM